MSRGSMGDKEKKITNLEALKDGIHYTGDKGPTFGVRHVQIFVMAIGLALKYSYRTTFSNVIIAMTDVDRNSTTNPDVPVYDWDNKGVLISSFFWGIIIFQMPAGYLGSRYGPKWFVIVAGFIDSLVFMLIPLAAQYWDSNGVLVCRFIQGLTQGIIMPMNTCIMGIWVPPEERSRMGFIGGSGLITLFIVVTSIATGYISESHLGWQWVYYIFGGLGLVWVVFFYIFAYQSPQVHPRITSEEKMYIEISLNRTSKNVKAPWLKIITCNYIWAIILAQIGATWVILLVSTEMSIYMAEVFKFSVKDTGIVSAIPPLVGSASGIGISFLSDFIPKKHILSVLNSRRIFQTIGMIGISVCLILITFLSQEQRVWGVVLLSIGNMFILCSTLAGSNINALDLTPMFAGLIYGIYSALTQAIGLFAPLMVNWIVKDESNASEWRIVFIISAAIVVASTIYFDIFASATRQGWDTETEMEANNLKTERKTSILSIPGTVP